MQNQLFLSLIIVSIDNISEDVDKKILLEIEQVIKEIVRGISDVVVRFKNNEVVTILSGVDNKSVWAMKDRVLKALLKHEFLTQEGQPINLTISLGVSTYPDDATTKDELVTKAEENMKRSKHYAQNISSR